MKPFRLVPALPALLLIGAAPQPAVEPGRLPGNVVPIHYDISIDPDAAALSFTGNETVTISVDRPTRTITLNAAELSIGGVSLDGTINPEKVSLDETAQTLTLGFARPVTPGSHRLSISFRGRINQSAAGLFAVDYKDQGGKDARMLVTQFEPSDGRRFAPMWDEPACKATFKLSAVTPRGLTSFSNMPVESSTKRDDGKTLVSFRTTPKMSSYLLFLGQGDVERRARMVGPTEIGVITRRGAIDQADYALDAAARVLTCYNDYFGTPYPLPKLDMIAAPGSSQFFSAMENWGAILYFDRVVLLDPRTSTESNRQDIFNVVAHEIAHQWFGNLVTMRWWDDLWLNEGFASWMAAKVSHDLNPEWNVAAQDVAGARQSAFTVDARSSTHPVIQRIDAVDEVAQAFDTITYQKGQAVIRMLEGSVGADAFRTGVRSYMAKYAYQNTVTDNLWSEIGAAAKRPIKPFMDSFTLQGGVPLIRGGEPRCAGGTTRVTLTQGRFGLDEASRAAKRWIVPVDLRANAAPALSTVSGSRAVNGQVPGCGLLVINPGQLGYFRTLPAPGHFAALLKGWSTLSLSDQVGLMGDSLALASGGYAGLDRYLTLLDMLPPGADPLVWDYAARQLTEIDRLLVGDPARSAFHVRARALLAPQFARIGFEPVKGETPAMALLRENLIQALGRFGDPAVVEGSRKLVARGLDEIPAAVRDPVTRVFAYHATPAEWEQLHKAAMTERNPIAARTLYESLGLAADPELARRTLAIALTNETTVPNRAGLIAGTAANHPAPAFDWAVAHAEQINALVEASSRAGYIVGLAARETDDAVADKVTDYALNKLGEQSRGEASGVVSAIRTNARLRRDFAAPIKTWTAAR